MTILTMAGKRRGTKPADVSWWCAKRGGMDAGIEARMSVMLTGIGMER